MKMRQVPLRCWINPCAVSLRGSNSFSHIAWGNVSVAERPSPLACRFA